MDNLAGFLVTPENSIREAIACIDRNAKGIVLVVDKEGRLVGPVTDGDVRRAILVDMNLELPVQKLLEKRSSSRYPHPITASMGASKAELIRLMNEHLIRHVPLLDTEGRVADIAFLSDLVKEYELPITAVVMAGGHGLRLRPFTEDTPKPMLPVGGRPLMELIVKQLQEAGIRRVNVTTHYKADKIKGYFGDGRAFGVELNYVKEDRPLGTAGALGLMPAPQEPLLVINGDILTQVNFRALLEYHQEHRADMTVAVRRYDLKVPYGVVECEGSQVRRLQEKPQMSFMVNAGIYLLEPLVFEYIPSGQHLNMTDLIQQLLGAGRLVISFPVREYWLDIGQNNDYLQAQEDIAQGRITF
jgi:dTDP-glucose pyrophosphorylase/CBS domain-containing protein